MNKARAHRWSTPLTADHARLGAARASRRARAGARPDGREERGAAAAAAATARARRTPSSPPTPRTSPRAEGARRHRLPSSTACCSNETRVDAMAKGLDDIAALPDPVGSVHRRNGRGPTACEIERVRVPLGVIGIIYESRPNVTADAGALCLKAGNAAILRGGSESHHSSRAIHACLVAGLRAAGLPEAAIQLVPTTDRAAVGAMLTGLDGAIDVIVPRGGKSLVERVQDEARVPVFAHLEGICHTYVDTRRRSRDGAAVVRQRQDAPHRRVRRDRDAAGRSERAARDAARAARRRRCSTPAARCAATRPRNGRCARQAGNRGRLGDRVSRRHHRR